MSTHADQLAQPATSQLVEDDRSYYVIELYTWAEDQAAAKDLAVRLARVIGTIDDLDITATTIRPEVDADSDHERTFAREDPATSPRAPGP